MTELKFKYIINGEDNDYPISFLMDNNFIKKIDKTKIENFELHLCLTRPTHNRVRLL